MLEQCHEDPFGVDCEVAAEDDNLTDTEKETC